MKHTSSFVYIQKEVSEKRKREIVSQMCNVVSTVAHREAKARKKTAMTSVTTDDDDDDDDAKSN